MSDDEPKYTGVNVSGGAVVEIDAKKIAQIIFGACHATEARAAISRYEFAPSGRWTRGQKEPRALGVEARGPHVTRVLESRAPWATSGKIAGAERANALGKAGFRGNNFDQVVDRFYIASRFNTTSRAFRSGKYCVVVGI